MKNDHPEYVDDIEEDDALYEDDTFQPKWYDDVITGWLTATFILGLLTQPALVVWFFFLR